MKEQLFSFNNFPEDKEISIGDEDIEGMSDPIERLFAQIATQQGLLIYEAEMIKLPGKKMNKWDKMSTVPDFLIKENETDEGIYVEVTKSNENSGNKNRQRNVMEKAGLSFRYVQITEKELQEIINNKNNLMIYVKEKIINNF